MPRPVLVVGLPRSGTTWVQRLLAKTDSARTVYEPDNESVHAGARVAKRELGRFPVLGPASRAPAAYERLWSLALSGVREEDRRSGRLAVRLVERAPESQRQLVSPPGIRMRTAETLARVAHGAGRSVRGRPIVKSVHAAFAVEWIAARWDPVVVVVRRHPVSVIASLREIGMSDIDRRLDDDAAVRRGVLDPLGIRPPRTSRPLGRAAWQYGVLASALEASASRHPGWVTVTHEDLCADPPARFRRLVETLGMRWSPACDGFLERSNGPGRGYQIRRVASDQRDRWRDRLPAAEMAEILDALVDFPALLRPWAAPIENVR